MKFLQLLKESEYKCFILIIIIQIYGIIFYLRYSPVISLILISIGITFFLIAYLIYCIFLETEMNNHKLKILQIHLEKGAHLLLLVALTLTTINFGFFYLYKFGYLNYQIYCPFIQNNISYSLHIKKRCELYNINNTQNYPYQYICSFNPKKIDLELINPTLSYLINYYYDKEFECSKVKILKNNNKVIDEFVEEYYSEELYYCDIKHLPHVFSNVNYKYCRTYTLLDPGFSTIFHFLVMIKFFSYLYSYFSLIVADVNLIQIHQE